jgi:hypothetical protein
MQTKLERIEIEPTVRRNDDLPIDDAVPRQAGEQGVVQLRKIAIQWTEVPALDEEVRTALEDDGAEAVPLRLVEEGIARRQNGGNLGEHGLDRGSDRELSGHDSRFTT